MMSIELQLLLIGCRKYSTGEWNLCAHCGHSKPGSLKVDYYKKDLMKPNYNCIYNLYERFYFILTQITKKLRKTQNISKSIHINNK